MPMISQNREAYPKRLAPMYGTVCIILVHVALLAWGAHRHSPTIDEWGHLPAGLMYWREGRHDVYRVNPPLVRAVATLPLLVDGPRTDGIAPLADGPRRSEELAGLYLYTRDGSQAFRYFALARWACIPFSVLGATVCYRWSKELYGAESGRVALMLWCFSPSILAYAQLITPDAGAAAVGVAAHYVYWRWLREPKWSTCFLVGIVLGLTLLTKTTWILLFALWPMLWALALLGKEAIGKRWCREANQLLTIFGIAVLVLNAAYDFRGSLTPLGKYQFVSKTLAGPGGDVQAALGQPEQRRNRFAGTWAAAIPVPFPRDFLLGIDTQKLDFESRPWSYLRGQWQRSGWWDYYLYAMAIKEPLGTLGLTLLATLLYVRAKAREGLRNEAYLLSPAVAVLALVSSQTGFNHHMRYVLPAFPYLFIFAAKPFAACFARSRWMTFFAAGLLAWSITSSLTVFPHSLSYFNQLVGGPEKGHAHLVNSNIDWGQDLIYLREWLQRHAEVELQGIALTAGMIPSLVNASAPPPPREPLPGWYAVSVDRIRHRVDGFEYFLRFKPVAMAGYSIYVYHVTTDDANRVRQELGLPEIPKERMMDRKRSSRMPDRGSSGTTTQRK